MKIEINAGGTAFISFSRRQIGRSLCRRQSQRRLVGLVNQRNNREFQAFFHPRVRAVPKLVETKSVVAALFDKRRILRDGLGRQNSAVFADVPIQRSKTERFAKVTTKSSLIQVGMTGESKKVNGGLANEHRLKQRLKK
ncbi:MAG: hypothetical protein LH614_18665 [Pyrinomonadaceae bacterium]|nr:hypothetical protein [Pyrinomonadaceae bacterium]